MYIYEKYDFSLFESRFRDYGRDNQFSSDGLKYLFDYLSEMGEPVELDVIALCCDFSEDSAKNVLSCYDMESIEDLQQETLSVELDNGNILYQSF